MTDLLVTYAHSRGKQPESLILKVCRDYLRAAGWYTLRMQQGLGCEKGLSDLVCIRKGRVVFCEIKTPTGRLSDWQRAFEQTIANEGGEYHVLRSLEDAVRMSGEPLP